MRSCGATMVSPTHGRGLVALGQHPVGERDGGATRQPRGGYESVAGATLSPPKLSLRRWMVSSPPDCRTC